MIERKQSANPSPWCFCKRRSPCYVLRLGLVFNVQLPISEISHWVITHGEMQGPKSRLKHEIDEMTEAASTDSSEGDWIGALQ